jgi:RecB family endonuclease NucS
MRLVMARCEVAYTGRLTATLPDAVRLLVFKSDGSVLVHDDTGGYKPLNWIRRVFRPGKRLGRAQATPALADYVSRRDRADLLEGPVRVDQHGAPTG